MAPFYTCEKNALILIALLKANGIRKVIASPGNTNVAFVGSIQNDPFFEIYSSVDERSAAYIACGLAAESCEPVVLSCTGATASRNYLSGLTEAYYRKLPILAVTSTQPVSRVGHHFAQVIDRSVMQNDAAKLSLCLPIVKDKEDFWECEIKVNTAILEISRHGGGPVHINLPTTYSRNFETKGLPQVRVIQRFTAESKDLPVLPQGKIAVFIGSHVVWSQEQCEILDRFCASNGAVVFCDHASNYKGEYRVLFPLVAYQEMVDVSAFMPDLLIHIGEITGDYYTQRGFGKKIWRVSADGEIRDTFKKLECVFEMSESLFFEKYTESEMPNSKTYLNLCRDMLNSVHAKIPELPFSNIWAASQLAQKIPENSIIHFGILNSLRAWNFFEIPGSVLSASNVGGFGIDGGLSSLIGASFANADKLYFGVLGDLAFFYDMNVLGNRHVGTNLRILLINNGTGTEFRNFDHHAACFGNDVDRFIAAGGHYSNKSRDLVRDYVKNFGFEYLRAENKEEFAKSASAYLDPESRDRPVLFEVFTRSEDESNALKLIRTIEEGSAKGKAKQFTKQLLGQKKSNMLKKITKSNF